MGAADLRHAAHPRRGPAGRRVARQRKPRGARGCVPARRRLRHVARDVRGRGPLSTPARRRVPRGQRSSASAACISGDPATLAALFRSELWRGRDNLRLALRGPFTWARASEHRHSRGRSGGCRRIRGRDGRRCPGGTPIAFASGAVVTAFASLRAAKMLRTRGTAGVAAIGQTLAVAVTSTSRARSRSSAARRTAHATRHRRWGNEEDLIRVLELRSVRGTGGGPEKTILNGAARADRDRFDVTVCYIRDERDAVFGIDRRADALPIVDYGRFASGIHSTVRSGRAAPHRPRAAHRHRARARIQDQSDRAGARPRDRRCCRSPPCTAGPGHSTRERHVYTRRQVSAAALSARDGRVDRDPVVLIARGVDPARITTLLNGIDPDAFRLDRSAASTVRARSAHRRARDRDRRRRPR